MGLREKLDWFVGELGPSSTPTPHSTGWRVKPTGEVGMIRIIKFIFSLSWLYVPGMRSELDPAQNLDLQLNQNQPTWASMTKCLCATNRSVSNCTRVLLHEVAVQLQKNKRKKKI